MVAILAVLGCPKTVPPMPADPLLEPLPVDPGVRMGAFDNGLRWYVEQNPEPRARAVLRLVVDAGSVLEDPDQVGVAHFVEHMAFNGTENFPANDLVKYLESVGSRFGPHLNAHTSFDETVYKLAVPTDDAATFERAFVVLEEWATAMAFDAAEVEKERGVVLEEWRTRRGAAGRVTDLVVPQLYWGSPYAERMPIGTEESLRTFTRDAAVRFYRDWYRPDLMAVIAVGDFDPDRVQALISEHFGDLPPTERPRERTRPAVPDHDDTKFVIVADPEIPRVGLQLLAKRDDVQGTRHADYRDTLLDQVALGVISERLEEIAREPDPPFLGAGAGEQRLTPTEGAGVLSAQLDERRILDGWRRLLLEVRRVREHGLREAEVQRAKDRVLERYERLLLEADKEDSTQAAEELVRAFTTGESVPGTPYEVELARRWVPAFTLEELDAWTAGWMPERSRMVSLVMPRKDGLPVPTADELARVEAEVAAAAVEALPDDAPVGPLLASAPDPGAVTATDTRYVEGLGFTGWTLSNGLQVWFKETDFKEDDVRFTAWNAGGESLVADGDLATARLMVAAVQLSGVGEHDVNQLDRWLAGKSVAEEITLRELNEALSGSSSPRDLEAALQMLYAAIVQPRMTDEGWGLAHEQAAAALRNRDLDPNTHYADAYTALVWPDDPRRRPWTEAMLAEARRDRAEALYRDRFGDLAGATFVFVGNLPDDFEALVTRWLATLPTGRGPEAWSDRGHRPRGGKLEAVVERGIDPKARVRLEWHGPFPENTWENRNRLFAMGDVLSVLLREKLREELGGVYGVGVSANEWYAPVDRYAVTVEFTCDPARVDELVQATEGVVAALRADGPEPHYVDDEKEKNRRAREEDLRTNGFWLSSFANALQRGADPAAILTWDQRNDALTADLVRDAAKRWLDDENRVKVVLLPAP